jgi:hypothetical protein
MASTDVSKYPSRPNSSNETSVIRPRVLAPRAPMAGLEGP